MAKDVESPGRYHLSDALRADKSKADPPPTAEEWRDSVTERLERLHEQVNEIHTVRKLVAWAVPTIITGTLTFIVTAFVAFYRLQALSTDFDLHAAAPATVAHPGTAESLWEVKRDVAAMQSTALSMQRELECRLISLCQKMPRLPTSLKFARLEQTCTLWMV